MAADSHPEKPNPTSQITHTITQPVPERLTEATVRAAPNTHQYPNRHLVVNTPLNCHIHTCRQQADTLQALKY